MTILDAQGRTVQPPPEKGQMVVEVIVLFRKDMHELLKKFYERVLKSEVVKPKPDSFGGFIAAMAWNGAQVAEQVLTQQENRTKAIVIPESGGKIDAAKAIDEQFKRWRGGVSDHRY